MTESEGRRPEEARNPEHEPIMLRLTPREINLIIGGLAYIEQAQQNRLAESPMPHEDAEYTRMTIAEAHAEIDAVRVLRDKLNAVLDSTDDVVGPF